MPLTLSVSGFYDFYDFYGFYDFYDYDKESIGRMVLVSSGVHLTIN
ncbi:MAG: hypothetical protein PVH35_02075 [Syntrophobacterales bacterium]